MGFIFFHNCEYSLLLTDRFSCGNPFLSSPHLRCKAGRWEEINFKERGLEIRRLKKEMDSGTGMQKFREEFKRTEKVKQMNIEGMN